MYWDKILINASQVTNPPIDPLREPMETRVFLGKRPDHIRRLPDGSLDTTLPPQLEPSMPAPFSPIRAKTSLPFAVKLMLSRAFTPGKYLVMFLNSILFSMFLPLKS